MRMAVRTPTRTGRVPTNLSLPADLVAELDEVAGVRGRSAYVEKTLRAALRRERMFQVWSEVAGSLDPEKYPHWRTSEDVVRWVREMRAEETDPGDAPT